jgi:hypothetical protein
MVGPLGRKGMEDGGLDYLWAVIRLPGRCPSREERLGLRPAGGSTCSPGLPRTPSVHSAQMLAAASCMDVAGLASLAYLEVCAQPFAPPRKHKPHHPLDGGVASTIDDSGPLMHDVGGIMSQ